LIFKAWFSGVSLICILASFCPSPSPFTPYQTWSSPSCGRCCSSEDFPPTPRKVPLFPLPPESPSMIVLSWTFLWVSGVSGRGLAMNGSTTPPSLYSIGEGLPNIQPTAPESARPRLQFSILSSFDFRPKSCGSCFLTRYISG